MTPRQTPWRIVAMLSATATASYICRVNVSTAGPLLMKEFNLDQPKMGWVFSAFLLGYAFFQVPAGAMADRYGARRILGIAAWLWVAGTILQTLVGRTVFHGNIVLTFAAFMVCRFLLGIAESPTFPGAAQGVSRWVPACYQGRANGIVIGAVGLGSALAPPLVSMVMVNWGWRVALLVSALPALAVALLWPYIQEPPSLAAEPAKQEIDPAKETAPSKVRLWSPSFFFLTLSYTLQGYVGYIFVSWFYLYLVQERHFELVQAGWVSSLPWVLSIVSIPLGGLVSDRLAAGPLGPVWGRRAVPMAGMGLSGVLIAIGAHTGSAVVAVIALALATAFVLCVEGAFWATMMSIAGRRSGRAGGIMNMGSNLGGLISPALTPWLAKYIGWENALFLAAGLSVMAAVCWLGVKVSPGEEARGIEQ